MLKPCAVVLAFDDQDRRQNVVADKIRDNFAELMKLAPADRMKRIDELLRPEGNR